MTTNEIHSGGWRLGSLLGRHRQGRGERHRAPAEPGNVPSVHHVRHDRATHQRSHRAGGAGVSVTTSWPGVGPAMTQPQPQQVGPAPTAEGTHRAPASDAELVGRIAIISEQLVMARAEVVLARAAYERAREEEIAANPWMRGTKEQLTSARIRKALAIRLAAVDRFRLWAQELDWLQREARGRGLLTFVGADRDPSQLP
jgi:hypothetical protein